MNIFKKIGSFATTSWKDFSELYTEQQQQQQQQQPMLEMSSQEYDGSNDSVNSANDQKKQDDGSFELRKRSEKEIVAKKNSHGFFRRHFSKKKLLQIHLLDDPRSPTTAFARTPIQAIEIAEQADILSPFNVQDMLSTVQSAVDLLHPGTPTTKSAVAFDNGSYVSGDALVEVVPPASQLLEDHDFTGNVGDWNDFQFDRNNKVMTESLIVELSTLEINKENDDGNTTTTTTNSITQILVSETAESSDEPTQFLLQVDKVQEVIEKVEVGDDDVNGQKCKIVGCIVKDGSEEVGTAAAENIVTTPIASTPKKKKKSATSKLAIEEQAKLPRTPLQAICNSPMVNKANNGVLTGGKKKPGNGKQMENAKKKKINTGCSRQLPKAPATPLTPLFKDKDNKPPKVVSHFDKENF